MRKGTLIAAGLLSVLLAFPVKSFAQSCQEQSCQRVQSNVKVVVSLTSDKALRAAVAIKFATVSLQKGNETILWLTLEGVKVADAKAKSTEVTNLLKEFISKGGKVYVCPHCARIFGVKELVKGAELATPDVIFGILSEDRVRVISW